MFRAAADQAPQVMWIVNRKGAVTYLNRAWYALVGGEPPKWYGHEWADAVHPDDVVLMRERWKDSSATGNIFEGTRRVRSIQGQWHTLTYRAVPVFVQGEATCWVGVDSDITELVKIQTALRNANHELEAFTAAVSHDLRSPLVTVSGFATQLARQLEGSDAKITRPLGRIIRAANHMSHLVDGLLSLSQVTKHRLKYELVDLSVMAQDIVDGFSHNEPARPADIRIAPALTTTADKRLMLCLLQNLLGNAWKFTSKTDRSQIEFGGGNQHDQGPVYYVRDNGAGFDPAYANKLFQPFERLHSADEFPGTGVGLATVHRIVTRHGGRVWAESSPGQGSCFYFLLPAEPVKLN